jgi:hypothetical protein
LSILVLLAVGGFIALMVTRTPAGRNTLWLDLAQGLVTLVIVGILGTALKLLADDYQAKRLRQEQRSEFRMDKYRRLVQTTNKLRTIQLLVAVDSSPDTMRKCMLDVLDVSAELRVIKHEIWVSREVRPDPPFPTPEPVTEMLEQMFAYTDALAREFDQALSETHAADGEKAAWARLRELPKSKDLLAAACREDARNTMKSWGAYLNYEEEVLKQLSEAALGQHPSSRRRLSVSNDTGDGRLALSRRSGGF